MNIPVVPAVQQNTIASVQILSVNVDLFNSAEIQVVLRDNAGNIIRTEKLIMNSEDYGPWSVDDQYVIDWVLNTLNLTQV